MNSHKRKEGNELTRPSCANNTPTKGVLQRYDYIPLDGFRFEVIGVDVSELYRRFSNQYTQTIEQGDEVKVSTHNFNGVTLIIYPSGRAILKGSFHKFHNEGKHNFNGFDFNAFSCVLTRLCDYFDITPRNLQIIHLEYGFNVVPPVPTKDILHGLIQHKGKDFEYMTMNGKGNYKQAEHNRYVFKIYDKAKQYELDAVDLMRIEVKVTNWTLYRSNGIVTLGDFLKVNKRQFLIFILSKLDETILYDKTITGVDKWDKYSNPNFWRDAKDKRSSKTFNKHRHRLNDLSKTMGSNLIERLKESIIQQCNESQGVTDSKELRKCRLTGVDISTQKESSFLLSHTGLYNLIENAPNEFDKVKRKFLPPSWYNDPITTQVKEIAHNIRTKYTTRTKPHRHGQTTLFETGGNGFQPSI